MLPMETRREFSLEFKLAAVRMGKDRDVAARQVWADPSINGNMLRRGSRNIAGTRLMPTKAEHALGVSRTSVARCAD